MLRVVVKYAIAPREEDYLSVNDNHREPRAETLVRSFLGHNACMLSPPVTYQNPLRAILQVN